MHLDQVLEHIIDVNEFFFMLSYIVKKDCLIFIAVPDGNDYIKKCKRDFFRKGPTQPFEHVNCFNNNSLSKILIRNNFKKISFFKFIILFFKSLIINPRQAPGILIKIYKHFFSTQMYFSKI